MGPLCFSPSPGFPFLPYPSPMLRTLKQFFGKAGQPLPAIAPELWAKAEAGLPYLGHLSPAERERLREMALALIAQKEWSGAQGLLLTEDIQLSIALQACLPVLNLGLECYRGWVGIIVYPGDFVIPRRQMDEAGVVHEFDDEVAGEAWEGGPVLLSWFEHAEDAGGMNVVIHEFAHKLDMLNGGDANGFPPLQPGMSRETWSRVFGEAFDDFCRRVDRHRYTEIDPYAAESPGEFFAVLTEAFFETPRKVKEGYPAVYEQLCAFYRQDPAARQES